MNRGIGNKHKEQTINKRRQLYKRHRLQGYNQYKSAILSGYSESYALGHTKDLETSEKLGIKDAILLQGFSTTRHAQLLTDIAQDSNERTNDRITAMKELSKLTGREQVAEVVVKHEGNVNFFNDMVAKAGVLEAIKVEEQPTYEIEDGLEGQETSN